MGKTYRSWQKRDGWREDRHREAKRKHFGSGRTASVSIQERNTTGQLPTPKGSGLELKG